MNPAPGVGPAGQLALAGRTALITGAAGDIGRAVALRLAEAGAALVLADRAEAISDLERTASVVSEIAPGVSLTLSAFDVTDVEAVGVAFEEILGAVGAPDLLFNNAGYQGEFANTVDVDLSDAERVLAVNVGGVLCVLQAFARALIASGRPGAIVNSASMAGVSGAPNMVAYSASKAAVIGMTKSAAKDLAPFGIRVNAISPGFIGPGTMWANQVHQQARVASPYYADDEATVAEQMVNQIPMRRYGRLDEIATTVRFLLSEEASYLTGTNTEISGGAA